MATAAKNLRTGQSVWQARREGPTVTHGPLAADLETDVLVLGAGITGALIANALASSRLEVALIDKRGLAKGSTTASTALVQYEIDTPLTKLVRKLGKEKAMRAWRRSRLAVDALAARSWRTHVPRVVRRNSLYLAGNVLDKDALIREHETRLSTGVASRYLNRAALNTRYGIRREAALMGFDNLVTRSPPDHACPLAGGCRQQGEDFRPGRCVRYPTEEQRRHGDGAQWPQHSLPPPDFRDRL